MKNEFCLNETWQPSNRWNRLLGGFGVALVFCIVGALTCGGCAENTESAQDVAGRQATITPTTNKQEQAAQGSYVNLNWMQSPGEGTYPSAGSSESQNPFDMIAQASTQPSEDEDPCAIQTLGASGSAGSNATLAKSRMGFLQINNITITTGGTTPTIGSGTATGTGSATQTPSGTQTVTANQEPRANLSVPIAVGMPGSSQSQQSAAASEGGQLGPPTQTNANPANYTNIKASPQQLQQAIDFLNSLKQQPPQPTPAQPTTQLDGLKPKAVNDAGGS